MKNEAAVALGKLGGLSSATKRFMGMTEKQKSEYMKNVRSSRSKEKSAGDMVLEGLRNLK